MGDISPYASSSLYLWSIVRLNLTTPHPPSPAVFSYSSFSLRWTCICLAAALQDGVTTCGFRADCDTGLWALSNALCVCVYVYTRREMQRLLRGLTCKAKCTRHILFIQTQEVTWIATRQKAPVSSPQATKSRHKYDFEWWLLSIILYKNFLRGTSNKDLPNFLKQTAGGTVAPICPSACSNTVRHHIRQ